MTQLHPCDQSPTAIEADAIVLGLYADLTLGPAAAEVDAASGGQVRRLIEAKEITGKANEVVSLLACPGVRAGQVVVVGLGNRGAFDRGTAFRAAGAAVRRLTGKARERIAYYLDEGDSADATEAAACGALVGCVGQDLYRAEKKRLPPDEIHWATRQVEALRRAEILARAVNATRRLVNEPPHDIYPESFAMFAVGVAEATGMRIDVWDQARLEQERCGSLLAVARGSTRAPRLVILRRQGAGAKAPWLALVGKGVTFDSGGLSLKPNDSMKTMKCDMAGAATVLGAMQAIAELGLPVNVIGLMGLVENMPSGSAMKLGDVLHARNGRTIEVLNTDAEGRLVLADVLSVAVDLGAERIIDLATLTGSCVVALGTDVAGAMSNRQDWCDAVLAAAGAVGEQAWQLPMFPEYGEQIKSDVADIKNVGNGRWGGAITAAKFLEEFVAERPWVHLDIAGPAFYESSKPWLDGGASGLFVRTLVEVARRFAQQA